MTDEFHEGKGNEALWNMNESGHATGFRFFFFCSSDRFQSSELEILLEPLKMRIE